MNEIIRERGSGLPRPGEVVCGKYRIDSVLGTGGMGVVMGALDTSLGRPVAIKFLSPQKSSREGAVARFLREARAAAAIQSEHVVRVFEVGTLPSGAPFIVMEHLRGADLAHVLCRRGALPIDEACDLVLQACEALGEAHAQGVVHRDLKPQNLFLTQRPDGSPCLKVLDFGISKTADDGSPSLTSTDMVMGTPRYMSPEQVRSLKDVDARADIWALGSILFELVTTSPVYQAPSASALCASIAMDPPTPLRARLPGAPAELEAAILRCLHKDPAGRFQDVAAFAGGLAPFASERGRLSATRICSVVRGQREAVGTGRPGPFVVSPHLGIHTPASAAQEYATTGTSAPGPAVSAPLRSFVPSPSSNGPLAGPSPYLLYPTTQSTWQQTGTLGAEKGAKGIVVAGLGALAGLSILAAIGAGVHGYVSRERRASTAMTDAGAIGGASDASSTSASVASSATLASPPTSSASPSVPTPRPAPPARDGGAHPQMDGGAQPSPDKEEERNLALGRQAEANCRIHTQRMTTFARDDAGRRRAAQQAKPIVCRGLASSRCEREVCKTACMVLGDQTCIHQIQYVIDHGPAPKY